MSGPSQALAEWISLLANLVVGLGVLGAPLALVAFLRERRRERAEREIATFSTLSTTYLDYLRLCLDHPTLPCVEADPELDPDVRKEEILLQIVVSMLEAAYFLYKDHDSSLKRAQWKGWSAYMRDWSRHPSFRQRWPRIVEQYDEGFVDHMKRVYAEVNEGAA